MIFHYCIRGPNSIYFPAMNKLLSAVGVALSIASSAVAAADVKNSADASVTPEEAQELQEEQPAWFEAGIDLDLFSAYVWRNSVCNDELVFQPCVWADFTRWQPFGVPARIGGFVWQNWDMTAVRHPVPRAMNETDFNVHFGATLWQTEDEAYSFELELGNDFFTYRQIEDCPNSYELYLKARFNNPFANVYGQYSQAYSPVAAPYFELGLNREDNLADVFDSESDLLKRLTVSADWNVSLGSGKYFTNYLYGTIPGAYDEEAEEYEERDMSSGIGGTTIKGTCFYQVCENFKVGFLVAYTALLSGEARDAMDFAENGSMYKQLVWCGLQAKVEF